MKVLMTSDLHGHKSDYDWILTQHREWDVVAIAGDLFDGLTQQGILPQLVAFREWMEKISQLNKPLAFCCGNHDQIVTGEAIIEQAREYGEVDQEYLLRM